MTSKNVKEKNESLCITIKEGAKMCGICENTFRILVNQDDFPMIKIGKRIIIPKDAFLQYLNNKALNKNDLIVKKKKQC